MPLTDRAAWRAYMREYMRRRRALAPRKTATGPRTNVIIHEPEVRPDRTKAEFDPLRDGEPVRVGITAEVFGDPPVGRSALDKKRNGGA